MGKCTLHNSKCCKSVIRHFKSVCVTGRETKSIRGNLFGPKSGRVINRRMNKAFFFVCLVFYLFIYFWLCWVFVSVRGLSLAVASGGHSSSRCAGLSLSWPLLLRSTGSRRAGSVVVAHRPSFSAACGIFPDQGSNPCPLHWQADSQPLRHQGSPNKAFLNSLCSILSSPFSQSFRKTDFKPTSDPAALFSIVCITSFLYLS